jgi:hypothetical protein
MSNKIKTTSSGRIFINPHEAEIQSEKHRRVNELIQAYDPYLELHWIPPGSRGPYDIAPWAVVHAPPGVEPYTVFFAEDADERMLARIMRSDNARGNVLNQMEAMNLAAEALKRKQQQEEMQELHEIAAAVLRSPKIHYKHGGVDFGELRGR